MSVMPSKTIEEAAARRPHYWFATLIWLAVIVASVAAVATAVA